MSRGRVDGLDPYYGRERETAKAGSMSTKKHISQDAAHALLAALEAMVKAPVEEVTLTRNGIKGKGVMVWAHEWDQVHSAIAAAKGEDN
jgi:L-asparaginase/Glu-tRNA(Gln) amidotransferase subunit D